jgi:hypothetical protein
VSEHTPWWYSGGDDDPPVETPSAPEPSGVGDEPADPAGGGTDWLGLLTGAQRMVDWATERVMAPHAEHADPRDHPQCVICRTLVLLGETAPQAGADPSSGQTGAAQIAAYGVIEWIPVREVPDRP